MSDFVLDPTALILVAVVNNPRDLEIARVLGWYRIPLRSAPKVIAVDYLAFYQTAAFGESRWQIQYLAPVAGHELTTRVELLQNEPEHPHAQREYYKIQLGAIQELAAPIPAGSWRRITFLYTTGELMLSAKCIDDLVVGSDARQVLWKALRERAMHDDHYRVDQLPAVELNPTTLALLLGVLNQDHGD